MAVDGRFKGGHITRHYGQPPQGMHAVQLEMCWRTYMRRGAALRLARRARGRAVQPLLRQLVQTMLATGRAGAMTRTRPGLLLGAARLDRRPLGRRGAAARRRRRPLGRDAARHAAPPQAEVLAGPVLPGLVDAHSHAFQRAFAGLAERRDSAQDDFWSWRDRMYRVALRITPEQLRAVAAQLYAELLRGGYTQVCEFHYLQHDADGRPYADPLALSWALADAAADAGIGLTLLPVLYERAGFTQPALRDDQRRFATDAAAVLRAAARPGRAAAGRC